MNLLTAAAGFGLLYLSTRKAPSPLPAPGAVSVTVGLPTLGVVLHSERLTGVHPTLRDLVMGWPGLPGRSRLLVLPDGGLRSDPALQEALYQRGASRAETLDLTAHGRGAAVDAYVMPDGATSVDWNDDDGFAVWGEYVEAAGLVWGGRWTGFRDAAHAELPDWQSYPYPPPRYA